MVLHAVLAVPKTASQSVLKMSLVIEQPWNVINQVLHDVGRALFSLHAVWYRLCLYVGLDSSRFEKKSDDCSAVHIDAQNYRSVSRDLTRSRR